MSPLGWFGNVYVRSEPDAQRLFLRARRMCKCLYDEKYDHWKIYVCFWTIYVLFAELWFEMVIGVNSHVDTILYRYISIRCFSLVRCEMLIPTSEKWCKQRCCIQWDINHLVVAKIIQAASIIHLSQDIISYNSAIAACEKGSRWQDTVLVDSAGNLIWLQKLQDSHSVMMTSFGTVLRRHWQQIFLKSVSWIHDSWSISWGTCLLLGECHSWFAACFGLIISPDLKERTLGPNDQ